jgi:hypothetical protein
LLDRKLCPQDLLVLQGPLQGWLHLHVAELVDSEIKVFQRLSPLLRVVLQEQLGKLKPGEGQFRFFE